MTIFSKIKHKWLRNIGMGLSLTTIAFVFQACYGPPRDYKRDVLIEGKIVTKDGTPIEGIKISSDSTIQYAKTDANGEFYMYIPIADKYKLIVEDDNENSKFIGKDTVLLSDDIHTNNLIIKLDSML